MPSPIKALLLCTEPILGSAILCCSVAMQSMLFPCHASPFNQCVSTAYRLPFASLPTHVPSLPLRLSAVPYHCQTLLIFAAAQLFFAYTLLYWAFPPRNFALLCHCNPALCHAVCEAKHTKLCLRVSWLTMQCPCDAARNQSIATPLRAFPWRISSVQSKTQAYLCLTTANPYLAAA